MIKKKQEIIVDKNAEADETWLIPYSDLLTLLLALFIVLFASSNIDKDKAAAIQYALAAAFGSSQNIDDGAGTIASFINDAKDLNLEEMGVLVTSDEKGVTLEINSASLFDRGGIVLKSSALSMLKRIATLLNDGKYKKYRISVEGHTDDTQESVVMASNWELSGARAGAIAKSLVDNNIDVNRLKVTGLAEISPAYPNLNPYGEPIPENRLKNRRIVIRIEF